MGCYQEGVAKDTVGGKDVTAHIFEYVGYLSLLAVADLAHRYTSHVVVTDRGEVSQGACPVQIIFCLKEQNKKKLNSHRWFFNAFGPLIKPNGTYHLTGLPSLQGLHTCSLHLARCRHETHRNKHLRALEVLRQAQERRWCLWRVRVPIVQS